MSTRTDALAAFDAKNAQARAALAVEWNLREALPTVPMRLSIHVHPLYGEVATASYTRVESWEPDAKDAPPPPVAVSRTVEALSAFPVVAAVKVEDGCLSFRPAFHPGVESSRAPEKVARWTITPVGPVVLTLEPASYCNHGTLEWRATVADRCVRFQVRTPLHWWGQYAGRRVEAPGRTYYTDRAWHLTDALRASDAQCVNWSPGSEDNPGRFTVYWSAPGPSPMEVLAMWADGGR